MEGFAFKYPVFLWLLLALPISFVVRRYILKKKYLSVPSLSIFSAKSNIKAMFLNYLSDAIKTIALVLLILAMAHPQITKTFEEKIYEGMNIVFAFDISGSMLADDFKPNRLEVAKRTAVNFIEKRKADRIGIALYAGEAFTLSPPTHDKSYLIQRIKSIKTGVIKDGTAIGVGLATAVNALKDLPADQSLIILLSDGANNSGEIDPALATEVAKSFGLKVYTIGIGSSGKAKVPENTDGTGKLIEVQVELDEEVLQQIAVSTGGRYFHARDENLLKFIFTDIDKLERTKFEIEKIKKTKEFFVLLTISALILLIVEFLLRTTFLQVYP